MAATPTVSSLFSTPVPVTPTIPQLFTPVPTVVLQTPRPTETFEQQVERQFLRSSIYSDTLNPNWSVDESYFVRISIKSQVVVDQGKQAMEITPKAGVTSLVFSVKKGINQPFLRKNVAGIRFRLNGGANPIPNEAMAVALIGSNAQPYWVADDASVPVSHPITVESPRFSETRLYYLGFDSAVPANTWVDVVVWLNDLQYDPDYRYVTGFQIKADQSLVERYFVDQVEVLLWPDSEPVATGAPAQ